jgi:hypothetical protein
MVVVTPDMNEDDISDLIEKSKVVTKRIRQRHLRQLKEQGWKGPDTPDPEVTVAPARRTRENPAPPATPRTPRDEARDRSGPPSRDARTTGGMSPRRRKSLRERFGYGD